MAKKTNTSLERMFKVRCQNPYFRGTKHGVKFEQHKGGALGMATFEQAQKIAAEDGFSCDELKSVAASAPPAPPSLADLAGVGPKTIEKLATVDVTDLATLVMAEANTLADATGAKPEQVEAWINEAKDLLDSE